MFTQNPSVTELVRVCVSSYLSLLGCDAVDGKTPFHIINQTEVLSSLLDTDHIWIQRKTKMKKINKLKTILTNKGKNVYRSNTVENTWFSAWLNLDTSNMKFPIKIKRCSKCITGLKTQTWGKRIKDQVTTSSLTVLTESSKQPLGPGQTGALLLNLKVK